jgi:hypothetical protein
MWVDSDTTGGTTKLVLGTSNRKLQNTQSVGLFSVADLNPKPVLDKQEY